jgi:hypothetical protein
MDRKFGCLDYDEVIEAGVAGYMEGL